MPNPSAAKAAPTSRRMSSPARQQPCAQVSKVCAGVVVTLATALKPPKGCCRRRRARASGSAHAARVWTAHPAGAARSRTQTSPASAGGDRPAGAGDMLQVQAGRTRTGSARPGQRGSAHAARDWPPIRPVPHVHERKPSPALAGGDRPAGAGDMLQVPGWPHAHRQRAPQARRVEATPSRRARERGADHVRAQP